MVAEVWGRGWERALLGEKCWKGPPLPADGFVCSALKAAC